MRQHIKLDGVVKLAHYKRTLRRSNRGELP